MQRGGITLPKSQYLGHMKQFSLHRVLSVGFSQDAFSHRILLRALARFLSTSSSSSCKGYLPSRRVSLKKEEESIIFVKQSASTTMNPAQGEKFLNRARARVQLGSVFSTARGGGPGNEIIK